MLTNLLIVLPLVGALVVWAAPLPRELTAALAVLVALAEVVLWVVDARRLRLRLDRAPGPAPSATWFGDLGVSYTVGFYGFSLWLAGLTVVVGAAAIGFGAWVGRDRARAYYGLMLFLIGAVVGVFAAQDLLLFYVFFEAMLIPIYVLVGVWGGPNRIAATVTFVIYTMAGSLLMLASIVVFGLSQGTFNLIDSGTSGNEWVFLGFMIAFAVKAPLLPVPRLAADGVHRGAARGRRAALRRRLEGRRLRADLDRAAALPGPGRELAHGRPRRSPRQASSTARCSPSGSRTSVA